MTAFPAASGSGASTPMAPEVASVVAGNTEFALALYRREAGNAANLFFSPYSISSALAMTYAGARGQTEEQMARALRFRLPPAELPQAFAGIADRLGQIGQEQGKTLALSVANCLWHERQYHFLESFLELNRKYFRAEIQAADFVHQPEVARAAINAWVERQTRDKIRDLLQRGQITPQTRLVLCNAIYFKGSWASKFDPKATRPLPFFVSANRPVTVPMMARTMKVRSREQDGCTLFELPYAGGELSMVILLPDAVDGLAAVEQQLTAEKLGDWLVALRQAGEREAQVALPKFKLNCRLDLGQDLAAMGMPSAFGSTADFSGITGSRDLFISGVVHQAYVDVNEEGTEAAAATGVTMRAMSVQRPVVLRVDHPFLFLIQELRTGTILFLGRVTNPAQ
jgi:serpin B